MSDLSYVRNNDGTYSKLVQLSGSSMELYGKSTDTKPTTGLKVGTTFFEIDTKVVSMWDGASWVVI